MVRSSPTHSRRLPRIGIRYTRIGCSFRGQSFRLYNIQRQMQALLRNVFKLHAGGRGAGPNAGCSELDNFLTSYASPRS